MFAVDVRFGRRHVKEYVPQHNSPWLVVSVDEVHKVAIIPPIPPHEDLPHCQREVAGDIVALRLARRLPDDARDLEEKLAAFGAASYPVVNSITDAGALADKFIHEAEGEAIRWTVAGEAQDLTRNDRGQITALDTPAGNYSFTYDNAGQMTGMNYPGGSASTAYNAAGQTSSQQFGDSLGTQFSYGYDSNGRLNQRQGEGADWQYGYDAANRLTSANHGADDYGYQYDPNGNRLEGGQQYDEFNKLLSSQSTDYDHDANGNRIRQTDLETGDVTEYGYDALNRLTSAKFYPEGADTPAWNASYQYDAFNRRTGKTVSGAIVEDTEYLWFGSRLVAEYDSGASTPAKRYRYTENSFAPVSYSEGNNDFAVHSDYLDTPKALTNTSGNVVWNTVLSPYGDTTENTDPDGDGQARRRRREARRGPEARGRLPRAARGGGGVGARRRGEGARGLADALGREVVSGWRVALPGAGEMGNARKGRGRPTLTVVHPDGIDAVFPAPDPRERSALDIQPVENGVVLVPVRGRPVPSEVYVVASSRPEVSGSDAVSVTPAVFPMPADPSTGRIQIDADAKEALEALGYLE